MVGSVDSLDFVSDLSVSEERNAIPIDCWQNVCLSKIWIPNYLLPSRKKPSNNRTTQGIFHTLEKRDHSKYIESFSVYSNSDVESEQIEIFLSDSDEDILDLDSFSDERIECCTKKSPENSLVMTAGNISLRDKLSNNKENCTEVRNSTQKCNGRYGAVEKVSNFSKLKSLPSLNNLSSIGAEEHTEFASSFEKLMNNRLNQNKLNNISSENKENAVIQNTFESFDNSPEVERLSAENVKIMNTDKIQILNVEEKNLDSHVSLHEILDTTEEINMCDFMLDFTIKNDNYSDMQEKTVESNKKRNNKKEKKRKKALKSVTLDKFLEDYDENDKQEDYCNDYLRKLLIQKNKDSEVQIKSTVEFPNLKSEEIQFIHSEKSEAEKSKQSTKMPTEILTKSDEVNKNQILDNDDETTPTAPEIVSSLGKIVIENIPGEVCHEDIYSLLCGYGEIKGFSLEPDGDFLKACVEIDLICDIDWIIECLNGTEPFGASSKVLKCYKQQLID